jgi:hypothetical protein
MHPAHIASVNAPSRSRFMNKATQAVYLAFGDFFLAQALLSAKSLRFHNPYLDVLIVTNKRLTSSFVEKWSSHSIHFYYIDDKDENNRLYKTAICNFVESEKVIYLDTDTLIVGSLELAFTMLDYWDIALRLQEGRQKHRHLANAKILSSSIEIHSLPHWNAGVVCFRNSTKVNNFFKHWNQLYIDYDLGFDQVPLVEALFTSDVRVLTLDAKWNCGFRQLRDGAKPLIIHYHSMFDHVISYQLLVIAKEMVDHGILSSSDTIQHYLRRKNLMRLKGEPLWFCLRRSFRVWWYYKNPIVLQSIQ